jgi:hypothetical protein
MALRSYKKFKKHLLEVLEDALGASIGLKITGTLRPTCDENPRIVGLLWKPSENVKFFQNVVSPRPAALFRRPQGSWRLQQAGGSQGTQLLTGSMERYEGRKKNPVIFR